VKPSPLLSWPGAVAGVGADAGVAAHYGDPLGEQRRLLASGGLVDRSHRGVVRVGGTDRLSWLHSLLSQHVSELPPGERREALVLSPHGHVEHHLVLVDDGEATWAHVEPGSVLPLVDYLRSMVFWSKVSVDDVTDEWAVLSPVAAGGVPLVEELVRRDELAEVVSARGGVVAGHLAWEALRVAAGRPRLGFETDHRTIPHEIGWLETAVHLDKGCYRGQETVARVHNLGRPPRRLVLLHLDGSREEFPPPGSPVASLGSDRPVGFLGTAAHHAELGPIALAVVKRQVAEDPSTRLVVEGMAAAIEPLAAAAPSR
jgi:folate-binding protein YgfZ